MEGAVGEMIVYTCKCGSSLTVVDNSEENRNAKREWKAKHRNGKRNPGHGYQRNAVRRSTR